MSADEEVPPGSRAEEIDGLPEPVALAAEEGVATQLDVTQAQRDAFLAAAARIQSDAELAYARASLRLAVGASLSSVAPPAPEEKP